MNKVRHILISAMPHDSRGATKLDNKDPKRAKQNSSNLEYGIRRRIVAMKGGVE